MLALWAQTGDEQRLDRMTGVAFSPLPGSVQTKTIRMTAPAGTIRYTYARTGWPDPPESITDGSGGSSPQTVVMSGNTINIIASVFDPLGVKDPSPPASESFVYETEV
jgi:hypothetical protein